MMTCDKCGTRLKYIGEVEVDGVKYAVYRCYYCYHKQVYPI
jgi:hypothetical protein